MNDRMQGGCKNITFSIVLKFNIIICNLNFSPPSTTNYHRYKVRFLLSKMMRLFESKIERLFNIFNLCWNKNRNSKFRSKSYLLNTFSIDTLNMHLFSWLTNYFRVLNVESASYKKKNSRGLDSQVYKNAYWLQFNLMIVFLVFIWGVFKNMNSCYNYI